MYKFLILTQLLAFHLCGTAYAENLPLKEQKRYSAWYEEVIQKEKIHSGLMHVISYNTWGLPVSLQGHNQQYRFEDMGSPLGESDADILALQETFHPVLRKKLLTALTNQYFIFSDYHCQRPVLPFVFMDCFGGLMTLSKYPIIEEKFYKYPVSDESNLIEKIGGKGFLISRVLFGTQIINVINTHLYSGDHTKAEKIRMEQVQFMKQVLDQDASFYQNRTILLGDFNIHHPDVAASEVYNYIVEEMGFSDSKPHINEADYTIDHVCNDYVGKKEKRTKLDYIFLRMPEKTSYAVLEQRRIFTKSLLLSDHFGWDAYLKLK